MSGGGRTVETARHGQGGSAATGSDPELLGVDQQHVVVGDVGPGVDRDRGLTVGDRAVQPGGDIDPVAAAVRCGNCVVDVPGHGEGGGTATGGDQHLLVIDEQHVPIGDAGARGDGDRGHGGVDRAGQSGRLLFEERG